jgi:hypothetical protein
MAQLQVREDGETALHRLVQVKGAGRWSLLLARAGPALSRLARIEGALRQAHDGSKRLANEGPPERPTSRDVGRSFSMERLVTSMELPTLRTEPSAQPRGASAARGRVKRRARRQHERWKP